MVNKVDKGPVLTVLSGTMNKTTDTENNLGKCYVVGKLSPWTIKQEMSE